MSDGLQFDKAEPVQPAGPLLCAGCRKPLVDSFYLAGPQKICLTCHDQVKAHLTGGPKGPRVAKAVLIGLFIAVVGGAVWAFITSKTDGIGAGLLAILLGYLVGIGVRKGSDGRGGRGYQVLAVLLTYLGLAIGFSGFILPELAKRKHAAATETRTPSTEPEAPEAQPTLIKPVGAGGCVLAGVMVLGFCLASPVLAVIGYPLNFLMVAIALWEGWRLNRGIVVDLKGPFPLAAGPAPGVSSSG